jgi:hypothetical protein
MLYLLGEKLLFADLQKFYFRKRLESVNRNFVSYKTANHKKDWVHNWQMRKWPNLHTVRMEDCSYLRLKSMCEEGFFTSPANLTNNLNPHLYGCITYLRTTHHW